MGLTMPQTTSSSKQETFTDFETKGTAFVAKSLYQTFSPPTPPLPRDLELRRAFVKGVC